MTQRSKYRIREASELIVQLLQRLLTPVAGIANSRAFLFVLGLGGDYDMSNDLNFDRAKVWRTPGFVRSPRRAVRGGSKRFHSINWNKFLPSSSAGPITLMNISFPSLSIIQRLLTRAYRIPKTPRHLE